MRLRWIQHVRRLAMWACILGAAGVLPSAVAVARADGNPPLTGTFYGDDNGVYYLQQVGSDVWWMGESVDPDPNPQGGLLGPYHVWNRGVYSTSVFHGTVSGSTLSGQWVEVNRGSSLRTGSLTIAISTDDTGQVTLTRSSGVAPCNASVDGAVHICASQWTQGSPVYDSEYQRSVDEGSTSAGSIVLWPFFDRFRQAKKSLPPSNDSNGDRLGNEFAPEQLRPYRDQTVFYGVLTTRNTSNDEWPHINFPPTGIREYHNFACNADDGDLDLRLRVDVTRIPADFQEFGWKTVGPFGGSFDSKQDILPKLLNVGLFDSDAAAALHLFTPGRWAYMGAEGLMYGGDQTEGCPQTSNMVLPGWADTGGNSILVNGRPIEGYAFPDDIMQADPANPPLCPTCEPLANDQTALAGLNGYPLTAATDTLSGDPLTTGTEVRVTGALALDCGHNIFPSSDDETYTPPSGFFHGGEHSCEEGEGWGEAHENGYGQNQEIHPIYSLDLIECPLGIYPPCADQTARPNLTGAWGSEDGGTYYVRQIGNDIWMLGLTRNRDPIMPDDTVPQQIPNPTSVFKGTISNQPDGSAVITGQAVTLPKGAETGGEITTATFTLSPNRKHLDLSASTAPTFPLPSHFDKLYEPPDKTAPTMTLTTPPEGAAYALNQLVKADYSCQDEAGGSGLQSCTGDVVNGSPIDTASSGAKTFTVNATDNAGNSSSVTRHYQVNYKFSGFLAPVNNPPTLNTGKAGRSYPVKWQLTDANGKFINALSAVADIRVKDTSCTSFTSDPTDALSTRTTDGTSLRYDSTTNTYVYNWATPRAKGCYTLFLELNSGQVFPAYFSLF